MISLEERESKNLPNITSLYFKLNFYNRDVFDRLIQQEIMFLDKATKEYEFPVSKLFFLVNLLINYDDVEYVMFKKRVTAWKKLPKHTFKVQPYKYQLEGIEYGLNHSGWLLLDDCGLGKTIQMIYLAEILKQEEKLEHCLIICGINGLKYNWEAEIKKFSNLSCTILGQRTNSKGRQVIAGCQERLEILEKPIKEFFVITNLETLQRKVQSKTKTGKKGARKSFADYFKKSKNKFDMIVLDEAHKCKDPSSLSGSTLLKLKSKHNIALTGTIIMNNPENAYVPLKWTGNLNCTLSMFNKMYNVYGGFGGVQVIGYKNLDLLREHIASCSLRRLKEEVLELPDKNYSIEYVEMGSKQKALYDEVESGIARELDLLPNRKRMTIMQELTANMRARQVTAWPGILSTTVDESAKIDRLEELVEEIVNQGDKVVVFCTFKQCVDEIARRLNNYNPVICTGSQSDAEITANKEKFNNNNSCKVLIATWQKMGTGHTLTAANYAIFVDTPYTNADFQQAADRIYRIGQRKKCFIITLVTKDTYDERVLEIVQRKEILSNYLIDNIESDNLVQLNNYEE